MLNKFLMAILLFFTAFSTLINSEKLITAAQEASFDHLKKAIELYNEGLYQESFDETSLQIEENRFCTLAYYYRARVRVIWKKYRLAKISLEAAFRDSLDFTDAVGLNAYILNEMGQKDEALAEWKRFLETSDHTADDSVTVASIMLPEHFHEKFAIIQKEKLESKDVKKVSISDSLKSFDNYEQLPMPVVDLVDREKANYSDDISQENQISVRSQRNLILFIIFSGLLIIYISLRLRKFFKHRRIPSVKEIDEKEENLLSVQSEEEEDFAISQMDFEHSEILRDSPLAQSMKLKEEREKHAGEINRLLKKI